jgi:Na+/H+ antiporter NhaD/arsenite permease-like protein
MNVHTATIVGLILMFVLGTATPLNMGVLGFAAAFLVGGAVVGLAAPEILSSFPGDLFVTLVGITYLFAIAHRNGTIDWLVQLAAAMVRGKAWAMPWVIFVSAALLTGLGAVSPGAVAILAPVALRFAQRYQISPLLMGLMVIHGAQGGGFSPMSVYGGITNAVVERASLPSDPIFLFVASLLFNLLIAILVFVIFRGWRTRASDREDEPLPGGPPTGTLERYATIIGIVGLAVSVLEFQLNVGLTAITIAILLAAFSPKKYARATDDIPWSTVLLVCGVVTYVAVVQKAGTIDSIGHAVAVLGAPLIAALALCYICGLVSAFASTVGVLGATVPLAIPMLSQGSLDAVGVIAAIAVSSTIVDVCPFSTNGALVVANARGDANDALYRQMLIYSAVIIAVGPLAVWALFVLL